MVWNIIFPTNQSKRASDNEPIKFRVKKSQNQDQICGHRQRASESRVNESNINFESS